MNKREFLSLDQVDEDARPGLAEGERFHPIQPAREIGNLLPNNRRQRRTCYALCHLLSPVSAAHTSIFRMDSNSTSCTAGDEGLFGPDRATFPLEREIFIGNLLVRVHLIIEMSRPALRHGSLNSLLRVALYLPFRYLIPMKTRGREESPTSSGNKHVSSQK